MTANELADKLDLIRIELTIQASAMLRKQQAEIESLYNLVKEQEKKIIDLAFDFEYARRTDEFVKKVSEK
jgi:hypothetical protein